MWKRIACIGFVSILCCGLSLADVDNVECKGAVVDTNDKPIAGVTVRLYRGESDKLQQGQLLKPGEELKTGQDGNFSFSFSREVSKGWVGVVIAEKQDFSYGWIMLPPQRDNKDIKITLKEPNELAGLIVDSNGQPIADVEVKVIGVSSGTGSIGAGLPVMLLEDFLETRTDPSGKFVFSKIPSGDKAEFMASKPGWATTMTFLGRGDEKLKYATGQSDIKIMMTAESIIEGRVVDKDTAKGVAGVRVMVQTRGEIPFGWLKPIVSGDDGAFRIDGLDAGSKKLQIWDSMGTSSEWVTEPVEVTTEEGKTLKDVEIKVSRGETLEITVIDEQSKKPIEEAHVNVRNSDNRQYLYGRSDSNGLAKIRLAPGEYLLEGIFHPKYSRKRTTDTITIEKGKIAKLTIEMGGTPKLRGLVRDVAGNPVKGAEVKIQPMANNAEKTDAQGRFEITFDRNNWGRDDIPFHIIVQAKKENLAWTQALEEEANEVDIKLAPAVTYTGRVVDTNDKAIANARITLMARFGNYGSNLDDEKIKSDKDGRFELKCVPQGLKCTVSAQADGYGKEQVETESDDATDGRLDVGQLKLRDAPLSVTGIVVDVNDAPVADVRLYCYGQGQPDRHDIRTDAKGRFTIDKICEGRLQISANSDGQPYRYGFVQTEGGATDVKIIISERGSQARAIPKKPASMAGKAIPPMDSFGISEDINNKPVLICFFDIQQRPSRQTLKDLMTSAGDLKEKGVAVVIVQSSPMAKEQLDEQLKKMGVAFPVGMIPADEEKVKFAWGVDGLPWLILTDKQHIVKAAGFDVAELNEKLKELDK